jgi:hypothetical protein
MAHGQIVTGLVLAVAAACSDAAAVSRSRPGRRYVGRAALL